MTSFRGSVSMPLFSIGVTTYSRTDLLIETLSSITAQTFSDFEVILANDNPKRTVTAESLGFFDPRIRFVNNPENLGELANMNSLLQMSRGQYFTWIADDDLYSPKLLQSVYEALETGGYPPCVFSSFQVMRDTVIEDRGEKFSGQTSFFRGDEFLRLYLAGEVKTMGTMGFYRTSYLQALGGLEDVSADGMGLYCEYMLIIRASAQEKIPYIDAPLMFFRVHEKSWSASLNTNLDQYKRATRNLIDSGIECFRRPESLAHFDENLRNMLRWFMGEFVNVSRRCPGFGLMVLLRYFLFARIYISPLKDSPLHWRAIRCLIGAETWLFWALCKQKFLAAAPNWLISFAYFVRAALFATPRPENAWRSN